MIITFDIETTGLQYKVDTITMLAVYYIDNTTKEIEHVTNEIHQSFHQIILANPTATYIGHNIKFDLRFLEVDPDLVDTLNIVDTTILYHYCYPRESKKLGDIETALFDTSVKKTYLERYGKDFSKWPKKELQYYNESDVRITYAIYNYLYPKIDKNFLQFQQEYLKSLYRLEFNGIAFDEKKAIESFDLITGIHQEKQKNLIDDLHHYDVPNPHTINLNSSKQLSTLLYDTLGIDKPERHLYPSGKAFDKLFTATLTNADLLEKIDHPWVKDFLEVKSIKSLATGIESYASLSVDNRLYPSFNITGTVTGRLSCSKPNLQNSSKNSGHKDLPSVRSLFRPNDGEKLYSIDYQQQEIRMLAVLSQDKNLLDLVNQGVDMHTVVGCKMFKKDTLAKEERDLVKNIHFGMLYSLGISAIAFKIGQPFDYAESLVSDYYLNFPDVKLWMDETTEKARIDGSLTLFTGRIWDCLPGMTYQAVNAAIQGSCAELTALAVIRCNKFLKRNGSGSLISIIHDELLFSLRTSEVLPSIIKIMEMEKLFGIKFLTDVDEKY